ncbi:MAG: hypothetical protein HY814_14245 [Candidatus Riflebacteria bacterium]|nr:hypothetical protein [Candidatus Riflebacteria bacterium]
MVVICNVGHTPVELFNGTMGRFFLAGRGKVGSESGRYTRLEVADVVIEPEDVGGEKIIRHERNGREVAIAIAAPHAATGIFVAAGREPTEAELSSAEEKYLEYLRQRIEEGMGQWEKYHKPELVDLHAKIAARVFGLGVPWAAPSINAVTVPCEGCGEQIPQKLAWHQTCGAILDIERAAKLGHFPAIQALQAMQANTPHEPAVPPERTSGKGREARL